MSSASRFLGITVNERLFEAGLLDEFESATHLKDAKRMTEILGKVDLESQAEGITETILNEPQKYGN